MYLIDEGYLTDIRTAVAVILKYLSNIESKNVGIIGAGMQELQLESLLLVKYCNIFMG